MTARRGAHARRCEDYEAMRSSSGDANVVRSAVELARLQQQADGLRLSEEACLRTIRALKSNRSRVLGCGTTKCTFASAGTIVKFPNPDHPKWKVQAWRNSTGSWQLINMRGVLAFLLDPKDAPRVLGICSGHTRPMAWRDWVQDRANYLAGRTSVEMNPGPHTALCSTPICSFCITCRSGLRSRRQHPACNLSATPAPPCSHSSNCQ